jgi:3',5'-cyclic AMP phosphodiesterase CpdA
VRTIVHLSDLHFGRADAALLEPLRRQLQEIDPDLVVISGDLTQRARARQFREARAFLDTLPRPQLVVPGNHDVPLYNVAMRFAAPLRNYRRIVDANLEPAFLDDEVAVVGVNTARSLTFKGGRINTKQAESVRSIVCGLGDDVVKIVVSHHPFDAPEDSDKEDQIVGRARMALEKLAGCGVDIFLAGHLHESHIGHTTERYRIAGVSALVIQAGTALSTRVRGETNSFNVLRLTSRHIDVDRYGWDDGAFVRASTHGFDHVDDGWTPSS